MTFGGSVTLALGTVAVLVRDAAVDGNVGGAGVEEYLSEVVVLG